MKTIKGSWAALITPFTEAGEIDFTALDKLLDLHLQAQTDGLVICGTTGEAATLSFDEKKALMQAVTSKITGKIAIMLGTGSNDTRATCELTTKAADLGAESVLVVTPYYNKPPQKGLKEHFTRVAASTSLPVVLYNVPGRTGCNMSADTTLELAAVNNIVAVKEASGNLDQAMEIIRRAPAGFSLLSGEDALNLPLMACGAVGTISVTANVAPKIMKQFNDAALKGDWNTARALHFKLIELHRALFVETNPLPTKAVLANRGLIEDHARLPLCRPAQATRELLEKISTGLE
jgi:4-hydroxy-tetrahydrodipicolinate synthase